jgi:AcrR family transcriptional regulator
VSPARSAHQPRKTPQQQRAWRTRERILAAAARIFADYGYASGTTDRIAAQAGLSIGSLYQYFPNKDSILVTLVQAHLDEATEVVRRNLAEPRCLRQWLPALTGDLVELHAGNPRLHQVLFEEAPRPTELLARFHDAEREAVAGVALLLRDDPSLTVSEPAHTARFVVATIESLIHRFVARGSDIDDGELTEEIVSIVTRYLR